MPFSWDKAKARAILLKVKRYHILAINATDNIGTKNEIAMNHPNWASNAVKKNFTEMDMEIKKQIIKKQQDEIVRRMKQVGKN